MKKTVFLAAAFCIAGATFAQDVLTSKKGTPILPEAGDYAIGVDATPFLDYAGNMFNGNVGNVSPSFAYGVDRPLAIYGKRFIDANSAYRATFRLGFNSFTEREFADGPGGAGTIDDEFKQSAFDVALGFGKEWRRGKGRLQGVYGGEALVNVSSFSENYDYDNGDSYETKSGLGFGLAVRGFVGVEYFFAPKMSFGAEYGYALGFASQSDGENIANVGGVETKVETGGANLIGLDTDASGFNIKFNFHF